MVPWLCVRGVAAALLAVASPFVLRGFLDSMRPALQPRVQHPGRASTPPPPLSHSGSRFDPADVASYTLTALEAVATEKGQAEAAAAAVAAAAREEEDMWVQVGEALYQLVAAYGEAQDERHRALADAYEEECAAASRGLPHDGRAGRPLHGVLPAHAAIGLVHKVLLDLCSHQGCNHLV